MLIFNKQTIFKQHSKIFKPLENIQSQKKTFAKHHQKLSSPYKPFTLARSNLVTSSSFALGGSSRCEMGFFASSLSQGNKILLHFCLPSARFLLLLLSLWMLFRKRFMTRKKGRTSFWSRKKNDSRVKIAPPLVFLRGGRGDELGQITTHKPTQQGC